MRKLATLFYRYTEFVYITALVKNELSHLYFFENVIHKIVLSPTIITYYLQNQDMYWKTDIIK
jgi:hypothetical protein